MVSFRNLTGKPVAFSNLQGNTWRVIEIAANASVSTNSGVVDARGNLLIAQGKLALIGSAQVSTTPGLADKVALTLGEARQLFATPADLEALQQRINAVFLVIGETDDAYNIAVEDFLVAQETGDAVVLTLS